MSELDRNRWNEKYLAGRAGSADASAHLPVLAHLLPESGRALDVAGGAGRHAIWLARRGLEVTLTDISDEALQIARRRMERADVSLTTLRADLLEEPFPTGPWALIVSFHFLHRPLFDAFRQHLAPGGILVFVQATKSNLERFERPSPSHLLEDGEAPSLVADLEILHYEEGWLREGRHDAVLVARRNA